MVVACGLHAGRHQPSCRGVDGEADRHYHTVLYNHNLPITRKRAVRWRSGGRRALAAPYTSLSPGCLPLLLARRSLLLAPPSFPLPFLPLLVLALVVVVVQLVVVAGDVWELRGSRSRLDRSVQPRPYPARAASRLRALGQSHLFWHFWKVRGFGNREVWTFGTFQQITNGTRSPMQVPLLPPSSFTHTGTRASDKNSQK